MKTHTHFPWQRLTFSFIGCWVIWYFLNTHRSWVWAYFESLMTMKDPSPAVAQVAEKSIAAVTNIAIAGITAITGIVGFFITGNIAALSALSKFGSAGSTALETVERKFTQTTTERSAAPDAGVKNKNSRADRD